MDTPIRNSVHDASPFVPEQTPRARVMRGVGSAAHPDALAGTTTLTAMASELVVSLRDLHEEYNTMHSMVERLQRENKIMLDAHDALFIESLKKAGRECVHCNECDPRRHPLLQMKTCLHTVCTQCITHRLCSMPNGGEITITCSRCPAVGPQHLGINQELLALKSPLIAQRPFVPIGGWTTPALRSIINEADLPDLPASRQLMNALHTLVPASEL